MITLPFSPRISSCAKLTLPLVAYFLLLTNAPGAQIIDMTDAIHINQPLVVLEKNNLNKDNASEVVTIHNTTNHSFTIEGPITYHIHISPEGSIIEERSTPNNVTRYLTSNNTDNPIKVTINTPNLLNQTDQQYSTITPPTIDPQTPIDPEKKDRVEERTYLMGYSKIIFRVFPNLHKTEITFVDERLSMIINEKKSEDGPEKNPEKVANYFDTIAMNPATEIINPNDLIENIDIPTLNRDAEMIRQSILNTVANSDDPAATLADLLNLMHPAKFGDLDPIIFNNHSLLYSNICRHFDELCCSIKPECTLDIWGKAFGNFQNRGTDGFITGYNGATTGMFIGLDFCPINTLCFGSGLALTVDDIRWKNEEANALTHTYYGFLYSSLNSQRYFIQAIASLSYSFIDGNRFINISPELQRRTNHTNHALTYGARLNAGFNFNLPCQIILQTYDSIDLGNVDTGSFTEGGGGFLNLQVNKRSTLHLRNELGLQFSRTYVFCEHTCWTPALGVSWVYQNPLTGNHMTARFQNQSSQLTINTRDGITNQVSPQASLTATSISGIYLSAFYEGAFGGDWNSNEFSIHMGKNF